MNLLNRLILKYLIAVVVFISVFWQGPFLFKDNESPPVPKYLEFQENDPAVEQTPLSTDKESRKVASDRPRSRYYEFLNGTRKLGFSPTIDLCESVLYHIRYDYVDEVDSSRLFRSVKAEVKSLLQDAGIDSGAIDTISENSDIFKNIFDSYKDRIDRDILIYACIKGLTLGLDDIHSDFLTPDEYLNFKKRTQEESYSGIGIRINKPDREADVEVIEVFESTPAQNAGIRKGDRIIRIEETDLKGMELREAARLLMGKENTQVKLTIKRENQLLKLEVPRKKIVIRAVRAQMLEDGIGYVRIDSFKEEVNREFRKAYEKLEKAGLKGLILDLRNNPGGLVLSARELCGCFLPRNSTVAEFRHRNFEGRKIYSIGSRIVFVPTVILVNDYSASASEITAAALQDHKVAILMGEKTRGKGCVQRTMRLPGGGALKLTIEKIYSPNGYCFHKVGIKPDIEQIMDHKKIGTNDDIQLDRAQKYLASQGH